MDTSIEDSKNTISSYQCIRQRGLQNDERYCKLLPSDIQEWIDLQLNAGYEVGIFDMTRRLTIYRSQNFKGHEDYNNVANNRTEEGK